MKSHFWDIVFNLTLAVLLTVLSETGKMDYLIKLPFVTIYVAYGIGRFVGYLSYKKKIDHQKYYAPKK